jgi:hypothetical protein
VQKDRFGSPEHDRVTNMGVVSDELFSGVMVTAAVPEMPGFNTMGKLDGETAVTAI